MNPSNKSRRKKSLVGYVVKDWYLHWRRHDDISDFAFPILEHTVIQHTKRAELKKVRITIEQIGE